MSDSLITVILPTYNPREVALAQAINGLKHQTLAYANWEIIIVDNNSNPAVYVDLSWHPQARIIPIAQQGLTYARLAGFKNASAGLIVLVDDDNVLDKDYLQNVLNIFTSNAKLGAIGGRSVPQFEVDPPKWLKEFYPNLALRDLGFEVLISAWENKYPTCAPIGAGMAVRKAALGTYLNKSHVISDRRGASLSSGGDNDINIEILRSGWQVGYFPQLVLTHIIPEQRMRVKYLEKLLKDSNRSWIKLLESHHISPWRKIHRWTVPLRKLKAWFACRAWKNDANRIAWRGKCGIFEALSEI